jgi:dipeptidyl aminopeptidase/acylaminoacyl peptidase
VYTSARWTPNRTNKAQSVCWPVHSLLSLFPHRAPNALGHLAFVRDGTLFVQEFDPDSLSMGEAIPCCRSQQRCRREQPLISFSRTGALVYRVSERGGLRALRWYDRLGKALGSVDQPGAYSTLSLSRDGKRVAFQANTANTEVNQDIWIHDFLSRTTNRLTSDRELESAPIWSIDGTRIAYAAVRNGKQDIYQKLADFTGDEQLLVKSKAVAYPLDWSRDGRFFLYAEQGGPASWRLVGPAARSRRAAQAASGNAIH